MKKALLYGLAALLILAAPANAATTLHISDIPNGDINPGDPVLITSHSQFFVDNVSNGQSSVSPTTPIHSRLGVGHIQFLHRIDDDLRDHQIAKPLVV
jgi:hypothetical protein